MIKKKKTHLFSWSMILVIISAQPMLCILNVCTRKKSAMMEVLEISDRKKNEWSGKVIAIVSLIFHSSFKIWNLYNFIERLLHLNEFARRY